MKRLVLLSLAICTTNIYAQAPIQFCKKISSHAHSIMLFRFKDYSKESSEKSFSTSSASPYWSNQTKTWIKTILNEAYKPKWNSQSYKIPDDVPYQMNVQPIDYARQEFQEIIYSKCIKTAPATATYCSQQALEDRANPNNSRMYRSKLNAFC